MNTPAPSTPLGTADARLSVALGRIGAGDGEVVGALYDETSARVFGWALRMAGGDREAAEAITLDVYSQLGRGRARYTPRDGAPLAWLLELTRRCMLAARVALAERPTVAAWLASAYDDDDDHAGALPAREPTPEDTHGRDARTRLAALTTAQRGVLDLAYFGGFTVDEIARHLGRDRASVARLVGEAFKALRASVPPSTSA